MNLYKRAKAVSLIQKFGAISLWDLAQNLRTPISELHQELKSVPEIEKFSQGGMAFVGLRQEFYNTGKKRR